MSRKRKGAKQDKSCAGLNPWGYYKKKKKRVLSTASATMALRYRFPMATKVTLQMKTVLKDWTLQKVHLNGAAKTQRRK